MIFRAAVGPGDAEHPYPDLLDQPGVVGERWSTAAARCAASRTSRRKPCGVCTARSARAVDRADDMAGLVDLLDRVATGSTGITASWPSRTAAATRSTRSAGARARAASWTRMIAYDVGRRGEGGRDRRLAGVAAVDHDRVRRRPAPRRRASSRTASTWPAGAATTTQPTLGACDQPADRVHEQRHAAQLAQRLGRTRARAGCRDRRRERGPRRHHARGAARSRRGPRLSCSTR